MMNGFELRRVQRTRGHTRHGAVHRQWITDANGRAEIAPAVIAAQTTVSRNGTSDAGSFTAMPTA